MTRTRTNELVVAIAALLVTTALLFAWLASQPPPAARVPGDNLPPASDVPEQEFDWTALGDETYRARCASCHREGDLTRRVPPLRQHVPRLFLAEGGRTYLIDFLLFGLEGELSVEGHTYQASHPIYNDRLTDDEAAAVLNAILVNWDNDKLLPADARLYAPDDIAARRPLALSRGEVRASRERVVMP